MPHGDGVDDVAATNDANHSALPYHRYALDFALGEERGNIANRRVFVDSCHVTAHDV